MLHKITSPTDRFFNLLSDDPVRPDVEHQNRVGDNRDVFVLVCEGLAKAICCVSYQSAVPSDENELFEQGSEPDVAIFYTIWSYKSGAGRALLLNIISEIKQHKKHIQRFVTLSPITTTAHRFHTNNGATIFRKNEKTVNYEYLIG